VIKKTGIRAQHADQTSARILQLDAPVQALRELWVDVDATIGADYGRALGYKTGAPVGTQKDHVVFGVDQQTFWDGYVNLVTLPTPVKH